MTLVKLDIPGGIVSDRSEYSTGPRWKTCEKVRFQQGQPEKIGGWVEEANWSFTGQPSDVCVWQTIDGSSVLAVGTDTKLQLVYNDELLDITPLRTGASSLNAPFATANESATVTVTHAGHGSSSGDYVVFAGATAGGGITVAGEYILTVVNANTYTIQHSSNATSTTSSQGGSSVTVSYLIPTGSFTSSQGLGWGAGTWGSARSGAIKVTDTITGITRANPAVVTAGSHPFADGDLVQITAVAGMVQVNGVTFTVANKTTNTFELAGINSSAYTTYGSAGTATQQFGWNSAANSDQSDVSLEPSLWSLSLWGEDLIATQRNGGTYTWDASTPTARATAVTNAPTISKLSLVSSPSRHLICFGAEAGTADPLNIRWSDQEVNTTWAAALSNTAGSQRLQQGTKIIAAVQTRDQILIFTDDSLHAMQFIGPPFTFGFRIMGTNCAPVSQHSVVDQNGVVYWMGNNHFYVYDGTVKILPSPVRDHVFNSIDSDLDLLTYSGLNRRFTEIWWVYATVENQPPDKYVIYNWKTTEWYFGSLDRSVWLDEISWLTEPIGISSSGKLYYHETGNNDNVVPLPCSVETGVFEIPNSGEDLFLVDKLIPDASITGSLQVTFFVRKYPSAPEVVKGPFTLTSSTEKTSFRVRGRQLRLKISSSDLSDQWKWGTPRIRYRRSGKR